MPDLSAFLEARAALDEHLSRLGDQGAPFSRPWLLRGRRVWSTAPRVGGTIAVFGVAVALLAQVLPMIGYGDVRSHEPMLAAETSSSKSSPIPSSSTSRKSDRSAVDTSLSRLDPLPRSRSFLASNIEAVARPSRPDNPQPRSAMPAPALGRPVQPNPPGRYDFEQEFATTGTIGSSKSLGSAAVYEGGMAPASLAVGAQARPTNPSKPLRKISAARRRTTGTKEVAPVAIKRVRSGVSELLTWVMPVQARPTR